MYWNLIPKLLNELRVPITQPPRSFIVPWGLLFLEEVMDKLERLIEEVMEEVHRNFDSIEVYDEVVLPIEGTLNEFEEVDRDMVLIARKIRELDM
jgi:hypothetical protein